MSHLNRNKNNPLRCEVTEDGELSIKIGMDIVKFALKHHEWNNPYDEPSGLFKRAFKVTDARVFCKEVIRAMNDEGEDGSTPLTRFLDAMMEAAIDDGCEGIEEDGTLHG